MAKRTAHGTVETAPPTSQTYDIRPLVDRLNESLPEYDVAYQFGGRVFLDVNHYEFTLSELEGML